MKFGVLMAVAVKITDFWDAAPLTEVTNHQPFERTATSDYSERGDSRFSVPDDMTLQPVRY